MSLTVPSSLYLYLHLPHNRGGRWGTTYDSTTSFFQFSRFSTALWELANSRPVLSLMLSFHLFFCLPFLPTVTVPCKMRLARPDEREICPYHCSLLLFAIVRRSSCGPIVPAGSKHRLLRWKRGPCMRCIIPCRSTSFPWLVFFFAAQL